jgi:hypothetical protein
MIKTRTGVAILALAITPLLFAQESRPAGGPPRGNRPMVPNGLGGAMRDMQQVWGRLQKEAPDPAQKDAALTDVLLMQRDAAIAKTGIPANVRSLTGDDKAKKLGEYRADMTKLLKTFLDLEDAINTANADTIKTLSDQVKQLEKDGHAEFRPEE